jgi:hypothetical protein
MAPAGAGVLYTVLAGAKRYRIEPGIYVRELLLRLHVVIRALRKCSLTAGRQHSLKPF